MPRAEEQPQYTPPYQPPPYPNPPLYVPQPPQKQQGSNLGTLLISALVAGAIAWLVVSLMGSKAPADVTKLKDSINAVQNDVSSLKQQIDTLRTDIAGINARVNTIVAPDLSQYARKSDLDNYLTKAAFEDYKKSQSGGGGSGSSSGGGSAPANQVVVRTYSMTPSMIYGAGTYDIFVEVKNTFSEAKKVILTVTLTPDQSNVKVKGYPDTKFYSDSAYITGTGDKLATTVSAGDCSNTTNLIMGTTNQILIGGNSTLLIPIKFTLTYCSGSVTAIWSPTWGVTVVP